MVKTVHINNVYVKHSYNVKPAFVKHLAKTLSIAKIKVELNNTKKYLSHEARMYMKGDEYDYRLGMYNAYRDALKIKMQEQRNKW